MSPGWESIGPYELDPTRQLGLSTLGLLVRQWRRACGLSQRQLAARAGINQSTISRLETGQLRSLRLATLAMVIGVLHDPLLGEHVRSRSRWA
jgi:transcriptional regulator with XRE-family HTH domain